MSIVLSSKHESGRSRFAKQNRQAASRPFCEAKSASQQALFLFHPDYTVGPGVTPDLLTPLSWPLAGYTAGGELHPALRVTGTFRRVAFMQIGPAFQACCVLQAVKLSTVIPAQAGPPQ
jgi:hypothetical protein